jgi:hypothetical protein
MRGLNKIPHEKEKALKKFKRCKSSHCHYTPITWKIKHRIWCTSLQLQLSETGGIFWPSQHTTGEFKYTRCKKGFGTKQDRDDTKQSTTHLNFVANTARERLRLQSARIIINYSLLIIINFSLHPIDFTSNVP